MGFDRVAASVLAMLAVMRGALLAATLLVATLSSCAALIALDDYEIADPPTVAVSDGGRSSSETGTSSTSSGSSGSSGSGIDSSVDSSTPDASDVGPVVIPDFAWYLLNETSGTTAHDSTPNHYDITNLTNVAWGSGAIFDGQSSKGSTTVAAELRQAPVSFTAWLAPAARSDRSANNYSVVPFPPNAVSGDTKAHYGFGIGLNTWTDGTPGSALGVENVGYDFTNDGGAFTADTEYFVAATVGTTTAQIYVNATLVGTGTPTAPEAATPTTLRLGNHNDDTDYETKRFYKGRMRDVRVYKRVLTSSEVAQLQAAGPAL